MSDHLNDEAVARIADGEDPPSPHVRECAQCANAVMAALRLKRAVREATPRFEVPPSLAARLSVLSGGLKPAATQWIAVAAGVVIVVLLGLFAFGSRRAATREIVDLHTTIVGSASPIDVVSSDRHTVKPWFEGRVPFAVNVPDLAGTPFRLAGGRVVFWRGQPGAYLLITKGAHRISLFEFPADATPRLGRIDSMTIVERRGNGLAYVAVGDLPRSDLDAVLTRIP
jgi:anti-sigma factor RsiW